MESYETKNKTKKKKFIQHKQSLQRLTQDYKVTHHTIYVAAYPV